jgi:antitoxin (DNA-binding transcriptional repressor) of toxin-antitoxin stability system
VYTRNIEAFVEESAKTGQEIRVGVREFRSNLTRYLREASTGRLVLVTSHDEVIAEIHPPRQPDRPKRRPGGLRGQIRIADDFDTLPDDILAAIDE